MPVAAEEALLAQPTGPRSTSSAMPDPTSERVPHLRAKVHQGLSEEECRAIPLSALRFRPLQEQDYNEMVDLHTEWFPVVYDEAFYAKSVKGEFFTMAATYTVTRGGSSSSTNGRASPVAPEEHLLGMVTMSTGCEFHSEDIPHVLGADCNSLCRMPPGSSDIPCGRLAYILTLGVADGFRRRGLARELLKRSILHVDRNMPHVDAVYLHVVAYNEPAIRLYEAMKFLEVNRFSAFYELHGERYDSLLYALYLHSGSPPWKWRFKHLLSLSMPFSFREWVVSAWCSFWGPEQNGVDKTHLESAEGP